MEVNDDAGSLTPRGALRFFASRLAPTGDVCLADEQVRPHSGSAYNPTTQQAER